MWQEDNNNAPWRAEPETSPFNMHVTNNDDPEFQATKLR